jgi:hypothetical protein
MKVTAKTLKDDGTFPNNSKLPLLLVEQLAALIVLCLRCLTHYFSRGL